MPSKAEHLRIAEENQRQIDLLDADSGVARGWCATIAFYAAIHLVEAFLFTKGKHSADHRSRDNNLAQYPETTNVYDEFCELKAISTRARYYGRYPTKTDFQVQVVPSLRAIQTEILKHC